MRNLSFSAVGAALVFAVVAVNAAEAGDWSGAYIGAQAGADWQRAATDNAASSPVPGLFQNFAFALDNGNIPSHPTASGAGFAGGVFAGYNIENGPYVWGIEGDISRLDGDATSSSTVPADGFMPGIGTVSQVTTDWLATLRARAGITVSDNSLLFLTGGLAVGHVKATTAITPLNPDGSSNCASNSFCAEGAGSETLWGWTIGGGAEHKLAQDWTAKIEYLYYDLGSFSYSVAETSPAFPQFQGSQVMTSEANVSGQIFRAGISHRF
jgi:outer membrane immunogenic protein